MRLAITGGTGFVGSHLLDLAVAEGHHVRALTRRPQPARPQVDWQIGALVSPSCPASLFEGCDAVIHVAGVINGDADAFRQGNTVGTANMVAAATVAGVRRFVQVSSLSAREPQLSAYGRSKREAEEVVAASGLDWIIVRPPAIYGPRDRELLELFRFARRRVLPLPPGGRLSMIHVHDLCRLLLACAADSTLHGRIYEADDGRDGGWGTVELAHAIGRAVRRRVLPLPLPKPLLLAGVQLDRLVRGDKAKLTRDRVAYFTHPDWVAAPHAHPPAALWRPAIPTEEGLAATARWYEAEGWL